MWQLVRNAHVYEHSPYWLNWDLHPNLILMGKFGKALGSYDPFEQGTKNCIGGMPPLGVANR